MVLPFLAFALNQHVPPGQLLAVVALAVGYAVFWIALAQREEADRAWDIPRDITMQSFYAAYSESHHRVALVACGTAVEEYRQHARLLPPDTIVTFLVRCCG